MAEKKDAAKAEPESKKKLFIIIGTAVLVLILGAALAWFFLLRTTDKQNNTDPGEDVPIPKVSDETSIGPMVDIKEFIVNIISEDERHYVKAALTVELSSEAVKEEFNMRLPQARDAILLLVGNKTYEELQDLQGKKQLKAELMHKLNAILKSGKVKAIYFTDFVVQ
ncbi:flagellar basal body-associated protein FliL [Desulfopila sp. IMCC35008]|uniref:flagellar basal body-associated FliL family protein n=1 Tax=Desulfopila sp. IMCC35008 TaxID=2653858 RepID=UPI0013D06611|nr:flagellar basal body-associated FliL family protein [Desulfopila sp. IMCC35008]